MNKKSEYLILAKNRENLYRFLGRLYKSEVDKTLFMQMKNMSFPVKCCESELSEGYQILKKYLDNHDSNSLTDLAVDYAKVFLAAGMAEGSAAFPYESVYTSKKKIVMQEARDQVMVIYAAKGLKKSVKNLNFFEDHISLELEFMAFLCQEAQHTSDIHGEPDFSPYVKEQMDFLNKHLLNWVPRFCADIEKYAGTEFYKGIGKITNGYLHLDRTILESLTSQLEHNL
ncbi:MAG TPA: molecular chaperone TorD [Clostridium sp.]|uniref:Molecular chaperone n=1 Tax=Clostridium lapidicellarium TaxID=3240931 RepID=A0ABV4DWL2_9CLOT|nr:molecular chaperone TorD family protein [uncultured Clostridium sp.]NLU06634.1 molecular chaperone TorD family protein [Clostridiales bacterium]HBC97400.1 molecular chaperone TorD [Clostridium sp.]